MKRYKAALIGCGNRSNYHVQCYKHVAEATMTACCDLIEGRRNSHAQKYGLKGYSDARDMIEQEQPDIVHIVTQPKDRTELMHLVAGLRVPAAVVEKPLATNVQDWQSLVSLADRCSTKFAVSHQFRWHVNLKRCQTALESGRLGAIRFIEASCGMNILNQGTHALNYAMSLNGDQKVKTAFGATSGFSNEDPSHPAPDISIGYLLFENGVRCLWNCGTMAPLIGDENTTYQHVRIAAYAEYGRVLYEEFRNWEIVEPNKVKRGHIGNTWLDNNLLSQAELTQATLNWIGNDDMVPGTALNQSLHEFKVVLALWASSLQHKPITIASFEPSIDLFDQLAKKLR